MEVMKEQLEVVWAKVKGYSWWPATVNIAQRQSQEKIRVEFFGESSHSFVTSKMIVDFRKHFDEYATTKNKKLLRSIRLAEEFEELIRAKQFVDKETTTTINEPRNQLQISRIDQDEHLKSIQQSQAIPMEVEKSVTDNSIPHIQENSSPKNNPLVTPTKKYKTIRKIKSKDFDRIPYRKFQDMKFQCKIVDLLNKLNATKNCEGDLEKLLHRIPKINGKLQFNKYIISGIGTVINLLHKRKGLLYSKELIQQIEEAYRKLIENIREEIHREDIIREEIQEEIDIASHNCGDPNQLSPVERKGLVKNIYKLLREKEMEGREHCQDISIRLCEHLQRQSNGNMPYAAKLLLKKISSEQCHPQKLLSELCLLSN